MLSWALSLIRMALIIPLIFHLQVIKLNNKILLVRLDNITIQLNPNAFNVHKPLPIVLLVLVVLFAVNVQVQK